MNTSLRSIIALCCALTALSGCATTPSAIKLVEQTRTPSDTSRPIACTFETKVHNDQYKFEVLGASTDDMGLRIYKNGIGEGLVDLKNIGSTMMGHRLSGNEHVLKFGWNVDATVIIANKTGFDFKATIKNNFWGTPLEIYEFCPFKKI